MLVKYANTSPPIICIRLAFTIHLLPVIPPKTIMAMITIKLRARHTRLRSFNSLSPLFFCRYFITGLLLIPIKIEIEVSINPEKVAEQVMIAFRINSIRSISKSFSTKMCSIAAYSICAPLYNLKFVDLKLDHFQKIADESGKNSPTLKNGKALLANYTSMRSYTKLFRKAKISLSILTLSEPEIQTL